MPDREQDNIDATDVAVLSEVQVLMAEKRTSLAVMRTGITVLVLPLTVVSALIATSRLYDAVEVAHLLVPLLVFCVGLVLLAVFLIVKSLIRLRHYDRVIRELKRSHSRLSAFID